MAFADPSAWRSALDTSEKDAAKAQVLLAIMQQNEQRKMYEQGKADFAPFLEPSARAMATLQSAIFGGPFQYKDSMGNMVDARFNPTESEGFKYTKQRTLDDLGRQLRMIGRGTGTVAANTYGRTLSDLNAQNEQQNINNLWNFAKTGQGAAGSIGNARANYGNLMSSNYGNIANAMQQGAKAQSDLYGGLSGMGTSSIATGLRIYDLLKGSGGSPLPYTSYGDYPSPEDL